MAKPAGMFLLKTVLKEIWQQTAAAGYAAVYYIGIRKKGVYDVVVCSHIGDFLFAAGYAGALKEEKHIAKLRLLGDKKFEKLLAFYPELECSFQALDQHRLQAVLDANRTRIGRAVFHTLGFVSVVEPANGFIDGAAYAFRFPELNLRKCVKYGSLGLSENAGFVLPYYAGKRNSKKKKVMLCPSAQIMEIAEIGQYMSLLAERFLKEGYEVYANEAWAGMHGGRIKTVRWDLDVFFKNCFEIERIIGIRSGLLDLAACTSAAVIALYPKGSSLSRFYDLQQIYPEKKENYQYILTDDMQGDIEAILSLCQIKKGKRA